MKKQLFTIICLLGLSMAVNAQLRVNSLGNVTIDTEPADTTACLYIKSFRTTPNNYQLNPSGEQYGIKSQTTGLSRYSTAVYGIATYNTFYSTFNNNPKCYNCGVYGIAGNSNVNIGVCGRLSTGDGAAVFGTLSSSLPSFSGRYAGYFAGDVHATKALTANLTNNSDWLFLSGSTSMPSILDDLADINVKRYYVNPFPPTNKGDDDIENRDGLAGEHYLLDISSVADVFPCLVKTNSQNQSYVNYTELIPVLVKAIQELKAQVETLSELSSDATMLMSPQKEMTAETSDISQTSNIKLKTSKLYQNTPNPFSERTEIRFSLPDDAQNAYIYIFDMQGKMLRQIPVDPSMQSVTINGYELSAGIYLYSLAVNGQEIDTKRMILSK